MKQNPLSQSLTQCMELKIRCCGCKKLFETNYSKAKYCSKTCSKAVYNMSKGYDSTGLATGTVGAVSELLVCADLLRKGYEVFRSVSSHCSCDLMASKAGHTLRVEVRTGYTLNDRRHLPRKHRADVLAGVFDREIVYEPELPV